MLKLYGKEKNEALFEYLVADEHLLDVGDDLVDYEVCVFLKARVVEVIFQEDVVENVFNIYRCYLQLYGSEGQLNMVRRLLK